jgi:hypothetical protein
LVSTFELSTGGAGRAVAGAVLVESAGGFGVGDAVGGATSGFGRGASVRFDGVPTLLVFFAEVVAEPKAGWCRKSRGSASTAIKMTVPANRIGTM